MRIDYYKELSQYKYLDEIRQMIQKQTDNATVQKKVTHYLDSGLIKINDYIQHPYHKQDCWVPLIYAFVLFDTYHGTVSYLLKKGADPKMQPDVDAELVEPIILACHSLYLAHLLKLGCDVKYSKEVLEHNMLMKLRTAEWRRLDILHRKGYLNMKTLTTGYKGDLVYYCVKNMKEYLMYCYNIRQDQFDKTEETDKVIRKFVETVTHIHEWGHPPSVTSVEFCIGFYMYEFLKIKQFKHIVEYAKSRCIEQLKFHEDMDPVVVATYRPLLNDGRYTATCKALDIQSDPRLPLH